MNPLTDADRLSLSLHLCISPRLATVLVRLFNSPLLSYDEIEAEKICKGHRHVIARLRPVVTPLGIEILTQHGSGYWMDNVSRANLLVALRDAKRGVDPAASDVEEKL